MSINERKAQEKELLEMVGAALDADGYETETEQDAAGRSILLSYFEDLSEFDDDCLGSFYFMDPAEAEEMMHHFQTSVILEDELPEDAVPMMKSVITRINFFIPYGCFQLSPDGTVLSYRNDAGILFSSEKEEQVKVMLYYIGLAREICRLWTDTIRLLLNGEMDLPAFYEKLNAEA